MNHGRKICVLGLGYVGLPVALSFAKIAPVIGFDLDQQRLAKLREGIDANNECSSEQLQQVALTYTSDPSHIAPADFYIIAVPTPIDKEKKPDLSALKSASEIVARHLHKGDIVVYESTVYPGATEEYCIPLLEKESGLTATEDFFVGYSPERINPGDKQHTFSSIKKIVSGQTEQICNLISVVYETVVEAGIHKAPSIKVAEAAKVIENTQRDINIALMNEFALLFDKMNIDSLDVLEAAATKWNFLPFRPGLVGGHCIGVDPYYLTYKASLLGYKPEIILAGRQINDSMGKIVATKTMEALHRKNSTDTERLITILGLTFKEDICDLRNSRIIDIADTLSDCNFKLQLHDPLADCRIVQSMFGMEITNFADLQPASAIILAVAHQDYKKLDWSLLSRMLDGGGVVFDVKGILPVTGIPTNITLLRL